MARAAVRDLHLTATIPPRLWRIEMRCKVAAWCRQETECRLMWPASTVPVMASADFVPVDFDPPTSHATNQFRLEPLGPQHNEADHAAWMSSIEHIRSTPGYPDGQWPPLNGMTLEENLSDLRRHADDFTRGAGYTFTVLDPTDNDVIGCVYLYPSASADSDVTVQSWVRADGRSQTSHSPMLWHAGSPPTGPGSVWTAADAERCQLNILLIAWVAIASAALARSVQAFRRAVISVASRRHDGALGPKSKDATSVRDWK